MNFEIDEKLLNKARKLLLRRNKIFWIVGGAGSGKTTISKILSRRLDIPIYDMDAHIYGSYHSRFTPDIHPVNYAWSNAANSLEWLLNMSWAEFNAFNQAALPEYLNLFCEDIQSIELHDSLLIDGGICNPGLLVKVLPINQIVCLVNPFLTSKQIWESSAGRLAMKTMILQLENGKEAWQNFLEFDRKINQTIWEECQDAEIPICQRNENDTPNIFAQKVAEVLKLESFNLL